MPDPKTITNAQAIRTFFGMETTELKGEFIKLSVDERQEVGDLCRKALAELT